MLKASVATTERKLRNGGPRSRRQSERKQKGQRDGRGLTELHSGKWQQTQPRSLRRPSIETPERICHASILLRHRQRQPLNDNRPCLRLPAVAGGGGAREKEWRVQTFSWLRAGVGKTYNMLSEAIRRHSRGEDVVIGVIENHGRSPLSSYLRDWRLFAKKLEYRGHDFRRDGR